MRLRQLRSSSKKLALRLPLNNLIHQIDIPRALEIRLKPLILGAFLYVLRWSKIDENLCKMLWVAYKVAYTVAYKSNKLKWYLLRL